MSDPLVRQKVPPRKANQSGRLPGRGARRGAIQAQCVQCGTLFDVTGGREGWRCAACKRTAERMPQPPRKAAGGPLRGPLCDGLISALPSAGKNALLAAAFAPSPMELAAALLNRVEIMKAEKERARATIH